MIIITIRDIAIAFGYKIDEKSEKKANDSINKLKSVATKALGAIGIGFSLVKANQVIEEFGKINAQIKNATQGLDDQKAVQNEIIAAANAARVAYADIAGITAKLVRQNRDLFDVTSAAKYAELTTKLFKSEGKSQSEILSLQEAINKSFAKGAVDAETINQIIEKSPAAADMLAKQVGVTRFELARMASEGRISLNQLRDAFLGNAGDIESAFANVDMTISDALLSIRNQWGLWLTQMDSTLGVTKTIAKVMTRASGQVMNGLKKVQTWTERVTKALGGAGNVLKLMAIIAGSFMAVLAVQKIMAIVTAFKAMDKTILKAKLKMLGIVAVIAILALLVEDFINFMKGNDSLIGKVFEKFGLDADTAREKINGIIKTVLKFKGVIIGAAGAIAALAVANKASKAIKGLGIFSSIGKIFTKIPFLPWIAAIGALIAIFVLLFKNKEKVSEFVNGIKEKIKEFAGKASDIIKSIAALIPEFIKIGIALVKSLIGTIAEHLPMLIEAGISVLTSLIDGIVKTVPQIIPVIIAFISSLIFGIINFLPKIIEVGIEILMSLINGILSALPKIIIAIITILTKIIENIIKFLPKIIQAGIKILEAIINGITKMLPKLIKTIIQLINSIISAIIDNLPMIISAGIQILMSLIDGITQTLPQLIDAIISLIMSIINAVIDNLSLIIDAGIQILISLIKGIINALPQLINAAITLITSILNAIVGNLPIIIDAGIQILMALINGIIQILPRLIVAAITIILSLIDALISNLDQIIEAGIEIIIALVKGLIEAIPKIVSAIPEILSAILGGFGQIFPQILNLGKDIIKKLWDGILSMGSWIGDKVFGFFGDIFGGIGDFFGGLFGGDKKKDKNAKDKSKGHADGGIFDKEHTARFAEDDKPEAIIPLTKPKRAREILSGVENYLGSEEKAPDISKTVASKSTVVPQPNNLDKLQEILNSFINGVNKIVGVFAKLNAGQSKIEPEEKSEKGDNLQKILSAITNGTNKIVVALSNVVSAAKSVILQARAGGRQPEEIKADVDVNAPQNSDSGVIEAIKSVGGLISNAMKFVAEKVAEVKNTADNSGITDAIRSFGWDIATLARGAIVNPATVQSMVSNTTNRSITQNNYFESTFNGDRAGQKRSSEAMKKNTEDATGELARALAYAR